MKIPGLHHEIAALRAQAADAARKARSTKTDPREAYHAAELADDLLARTVKLAEHLKSDEALLEGIQQLRCYLSASKQESRGRQDIMSHLNAAAGILLLEIGTPEPERDFQVLPDPPPTNGAKPRTPRKKTK